MTYRVEIYTDGACSGNPGIGGWGCVLRCKEQEKELSGGELETTNNRMELTAVIEALKALKTRCNVTLYTDSQYVMKGITEWMDSWKKNGWKTKSKKNEVKNIDLWQMLDTLISNHEIRFVWVKGHNGDEGNERVDTLARNAVVKLKKSLPQQTT